MGQTGTVTPLEKFTETASLLISHSMSTIIDKRIAVRVTYTKESAYLIKRNTQIVEFSVAIPEQSKHIKPLVMTILCMIPRGDSDMTAYLNELLRTKKPEQQNNTSWFPTPENSGKSEDHTPIQARILKEFFEIKEKEKLNPQESTESCNKVLKRFDWFHDSKGNRKTSTWIYPCRLFWHFWQTQNGHWVEHGNQVETNS